MASHRNKIRTYEGASIVPVSYTHLDVYKRQAFTDLDSWISIGAPILFDVIIVLLYILSHKAAGYVLMENMMITSSGFLAKHYTVFEYKKMQVLEMDYHPAVRKLGIGNGVVYLLNTITSIPYIKKELASEISEKMIGGKMCIRDRVNPK